METPVTNDPILSALARQVECYERLSRLSISQHAHVRDSRTRELLEVIAQRQEVLDQIADLQQIVGPARQRWADFLNELSAANRAAATSMMDRIKQLLSELTESDLKDSLVMQQRMLRLGREINQATVARQINRKYAGAAYGFRPPALDLQR